MDVLNNISKIYFSEYLFKYKIRLWLKLLHIDKTFFKYALYNLLHDKIRNYEWLIYHAVQLDYLNFITVLAPLSNYTNYWYSIDYAAGKNRLDIVQILEPYNTNKNYLNIISRAAHRNHLDMVQFLEPYNTNKNYFALIGQMIHTNNLALIQILAPQATNIGYAYATRLIRLATQRGYTDIVQYLSRIYADIINR